MNILFLGRADTPLPSWYIKSLDLYSSKTVVLNTNPSTIISKIKGFDGKIFNLYKNRKGFSNKFIEWLKFYPRILLKSNKWYSYDKKTLSIIIKIIKVEEIDLIFAWWGVDILYELNLILSAKINIKLIWALIVFPSSIFFYNRIVEKILIKRILSKINCLIYGSELQKKYVNANYSIKSTIRELVFTQTNSIDTYFKRRLHKISKKDGKIHIVFIGRTDFTRDIRRIKDDVRYILDELENDKVVIHIAKTQSKISTSNVVFFDSFSQEQILNGKFATFLTKFDICLVAYNYKDTKYHERFDTGIPARMSSAISAGIPIIIQEGTMKACADFILKHEIGLTYKNVEDLLEKIKMEKFIRIEKNAKRKVFNFTFEKEFQKIGNLILEVYSENGGIKYVKS